MAEGFEPSEGGYPSHAFEACSLGRSDTPPLVTLPDDPAETEIASSGALGVEEGVEQCGAIGFEDTAADLGAMIETSVTDDVPQGADRTGFGFPGTEDQAADAG